MKKLIALLAAVTLCLGFISCSSTKKENSAMPEKMVAEKLSDVAYKRGLVEIPGELYQIFTFEPYNNSGNFFILGAGSTIPAFYTVDAGFTNYSKLEIPDFSIGVSYDLNISDDGVIVSVVNHVDYGGLPDPDPYAEDYDEELYKSAAEYCMMVNTYSINGEQLSSCPIEGLPFEANESISVMGVVTDGNNVITKISNTYYIIGTDGTFKGELKTDSEDKIIEQVGTDRDGNIVCAVVNKETDELQICKVDTEKCVPIESDITYTFPESIMLNIKPGTGDYSMYVSSRTTVYGIRSDDASIEPVFSIFDSGINANIMSDFFVDTDGSVVIPDNGTDFMSVKMRRYTQCDPAELEAIPTITVGMWNNDYHMPDYISDLNDTQGEYRVELKVYQADYQEGDYEAAVGQFEEDVLAGNLPDILMIDDNGMFGETDMIQQGSLYDLYELMDKDDELTREDFIPNILTLSETDGHLYSISNRIYVEAGYVIKSKYAEEIDKWDFDTYMELVRNLPEGMELTENGGPETKSGRFGEVPVSDFIDFENATCSFDSEEFIECLEYCNEAPLEYVDENMYQGDWSVMTDELQAYLDAEHTKSQMAHREDRALLHDFYLGIYESYRDMKEGRFGGEDITVLGYPSKDGGIVKYRFDNSFSITANSDNKELAWEFIKTMFTDDYFRENTVSHVNGYSVRGGFPTTISGLDILAENEQVPFNNSTYKDPSYTGTFYQVGPDEIYEIGLVDEEDVAEVNEIIYSLEPVEYYYVYSCDDTICSILLEESDRYFNGECSAEDCADAIQGRVSIYLAEKS